MSNHPRLFDYRVKSIVVLWVAVFLVVCQAPLQDSSDPNVSLWPQKPNDPAAIDRDDISDENISTRLSRQQLVRHSHLSLQVVVDFLLNIAHKLLSTTCTSL